MAWEDEMRTRGLKACVFLVALGPLSLSLSVLSDWVGFGLLGFMYLIYKLREEKAKKKDD